MNNNTPPVDLAKIKIDPEVLRLIPFITAQKYRAIAFEKHPDGIKLALSQPADENIVNYLQKTLNSPVLVYSAPDQEIERALKLYQAGATQTFDQLISQPTADDPTKELPTEKIVQKLFEYALDNRASDIHIEPYRSNTLLRFRIDGVMHDIATLPKNLHEQIIARIKVLAGLRIDERRAAQDGKLKIKYGKKTVGLPELTDVRVSIVPSINGENAVMRILSERSRQFSLQSIGLSAEHLKIIQHNISKTWGMILAVGPTGSGKTTTLYSIIKVLNQREVKIATIEDPVEYDIEGVIQIQVDPKKKLTFTNGLRSLVRQDPDIIMVGEIRDEETAKMAVNSGMTGHLVMSTLHANDAVTTLPRLIDMDIEPYIIASTVNLIIAQRIIRKICPKCRVSYQENADKLKISLPARIFENTLKGQTSFKFYRGKGCAECQMSGFKGRIGIYEVLQMTPEIEKLVMERANASQISDKAIELGMKTILEDGWQKVLQGITTFNEVIKATRE